MKVTVDIPDGIYRQVKAKSALEGWSVREVATTLFRTWVAQPGSGTTDAKAHEGGIHEIADPPWFGSLRGYARNAKGRHDMDSIRRSIARGRAREARS
jgi:hypothetical protein